MQLYTQGAGLSLPSGRRKGWTINSHGKGDVTLTPEECETAIIIGERRDREAIELGYSADRYGDPGNTRKNHINGAYGEYAASMVLGVYWPARIGVFHKKADIGQNVEARNRRKFHWDLIVRPDDEPSRYYVLVTGTAPHFIVHGWILGQDARRDEWWKTYSDRPKVWFVPQEFLHPLADLIPLIIL